jgi:hypothetical protein
MIWLWIVVALVVIAIIAFAVARQQKTKQLQGRFGPEYDRTLEGADSRREGERNLRERAERRDQFELRPLTPQARERYSEQWKTVQAQFVDSPSLAVREGDKLITEIMRERGYPMDEWDQRADDLSVDHPDVVNHYRSAHGVMHSDQQGEGASTEDLRRAMTDLRSLFERLLHDGDGEDASASTRGVRDTTEPPVSERQGRVADEPTGEPVERERTTREV